MSLALLVPYAHLGHWYVQLAFAVPALVIIGYMARDSLRRRWRERRGEPPPLPGSARKPETPPKRPPERRG